MRVSSLLMIPACAVFLAACSTAADRQEASVPTAEPEKVAPAEPEVSEPATASRDRMICKSVAPTGSRIARKSCKTQGEWDDLQRSGQDAAESVKRRGAQSVQPSG
jgi:hypothetical protein